MDYKLKNSEILLIEVLGNQAKQTRASSAEITKGIIPGRSNEDYLPRRKKADGFIQFYDLGYFNNSGTFTDNVALRISANTDTEGRSDFIAEISSSPLGDIPLPFLDVSLSYYANRDSAILGRNLTNYKNLSNLIAEFEADEFPFAGIINVFGDGFSYANNAVTGNEELAEKWKPNSGLQLSNTELANLEGIEIANSRAINFIGVDANKITAIYDYEAPPIVFTPSGKMSIFFFPLIVQAQAFSRQQIYEGSIAQDLWAGNLILTDLRDWIYNPSNPAYQIGYGGAFVRASSSQGSQDFYDGAYNSVIRSDGFGLNGSSVINTLFPPAGDDPYESNPTGYAERLQMDMKIFDEPEGSLLAIIKQNNQTFYVWN